MASTPKKGRPASGALVRTPAPAPAFEAPALEAPAFEAHAKFEAHAPEATDVSTLALQAAEASPPVAEIPETGPVAETADVRIVEAAPETFADAAPQVPPAPEPLPVPVETVALPAPVAAATGDIRALFEKGLIQTRARYADASTAAQEASAAVDASLGAVQHGVAAFHAKAIEALTTGAHAQFDHLVSLASAKSLSELVALQSEFARKRFEDAATQAKQLSELARKVAGESVAPIQAHVAKTFKAAS